MSETAVQALFYGLLLLMPLTALLARRVHLATAVKYAVAWVVIFVAAVLLVQAIMT